MCYVLLLMVFGVVVFFFLNKVVEGMVSYFLCFWLNLHLMVIVMFWSQIILFIYKPLLYGLFLFSGVLLALQSCMNGVIIDSVTINLTRGGN